MSLKALRNKPSPEKKTSISQLSQIREKFERIGYDYMVYKGGKDKVMKSTTHRDKLKGAEIYIQITYSGICGID